MVDFSGCGKRNLRKKDKSVQTKANNFIKHCGIDWDERVSIQTRFLQINIFYCEEVIVLAMKS